MQLNWKDIWFWAVFFLVERCRCLILHHRRPDFPQLMRLRKGKAKNLNAEMGFPLSRWGVCAKVSKRSITFFSFAQLQNLLFSLVFRITTETNLFPSGIFRWVDVVPCISCSASEPLGFVQKLLAIPGLSHFRSRLTSFNYVPGNHQTKGCSAIRHWGAVGYSKLWRTVGYCIVFGINRDLTLTR